MNRCIGLRCVSCAFMGNGQYACEFVVLEGSPPAEQIMKVTLFMDTPLLVGSLYELVLRGVFPKETGSAYRQTRSIEHLRIGVEGMPNIDWPEWQNMIKEESNE